MTPVELRAAREALSLTGEALATLLGISDSRTVRRWEAGDSEIPGPVALVVRILLRHAPVRRALGVTLTRRRAAD